jgi:hypothetical protein
VLLLRSERQLSALPPGDAIILGGGWRAPHTVDTPIEGCPVLLSLRRRLVGPRSVRLISSMIGLRASGVRVVSTLA